MIKNIAEIMGHIHTRAIDDLPVQDLIEQLTLSYPDCEFSYTDVDESPYADGTHVTKYDYENWIIIRPRKHVTLQAIPGEFGKNKNADALADCLRNWKETAAQQIELLHIVAQTHRVYYEALLLQKFTKPEALELLKSKIISEGGRS